MQRNVCSSDLVVAWNTQIWMKMQFEIIFKSKKLKAFSCKK